MTTNFITPPDFVDDDNFNILLIDVDPADVETLVYLCANHDESFNIYLYRAEHEDTLYMNRCADRANAIIINTEPNSLSQVKDHLVDLSKSWHYGPKRFMNRHRIENVLEYFINRANERKYSTNSL